jgi:tRNA U34 5-carboxymethylaminomethyl modifying GTPase MnmE/TrmE
MAPDATSENQAMLLTPSGTGAIAVVRLAGPGLARFLSMHFSRPARAGFCVHGNLIDGDRTIDDPVVVLAADHSFADINLHGGPWVVQACIELAERSGFTLANALSARGVDAGNLLEQEVLTHLPLARTEMALRVLLAQQAAWAEVKRRCPEGSVLQAILDDR